MSSLNKFFEKPILSKIKNFFVSENSYGHKKNKSEEKDNSFALVENQYEINENYFEKTIISQNSNNNFEFEGMRKSDKLESFSTIALYENEFSDFIILEFGDSKIISKEEWDDIFKRKSLLNIPHKDLYVSLQKGINFLM